MYVTRKIEKKNETFRLKTRVKNKINKVNTFCDKEKKEWLNEEEQKTKKENNEKDERK